MVKKGKNWQNSPFEFVFKINGHIICKRGFSVDDYNSDVVNSMELKELMDTIGGMNNGESGSLGIIPNHLKKQSEDYMWSKHNPDYYQTKEQLRLSREMQIRKDIFTFEIWKRNHKISSCSFDNRFMLYSIDNQVDITKLIPELVDEISEVFSLDEYTIGYLDGPLKYSPKNWSDKSTFTV